MLKLALGTSFSIILLVLGLLSLGWNAGAFEPSNAVAGIVDGYRAIISPLFSSLEQILPVPRWEITETEADLYVVLSLCILPIIVAGSPIPKLERYVFPSVVDGIIRIVHVLGYVLVIYILGIAQIDDRVTSQLLLMGLSYLIVFPIFSAVFLAYGRFRGTRLKSLSYIWRYTRNVLGALLIILGFVQSGLVTLL